MASQRNKIQQHTRLEPDKIPILDARFCHVHLGSRTTSNIQRKFCLTMIDRYTRWPEAVLVKDTTTETIANTFYSVWIARFGAPVTITTDRDVQFKSQIFEILNNLFVIYAQPHITHRATG